MKRAFKKARSAFSELTGDLEWMTDRGVESYFSYFVSREFKRWLAGRDARVFLEVTIAQIEDHARRRIRRGARGKALQRRNRVDIVITDKNLRALGVVELKRNKFQTGWKTDLERVERMVSRMAMPFGCFGLVLSEREKSGYIDDALTRLDRHVERRRLKMDAGVKLTKFVTFRSRYQAVDEGGERHALAFAGCVYTR